METLADIWGKIGLFHPYVVTKDLDWDTVLVAAIPAIEKARSPEEFVSALNEKLLKPLGDPLTYARTTSQADLLALTSPPDFSTRVLRPHVGYVAVTNSFLPLEGNFLKQFLDSVRSLRADTLVVDLRWWSKRVSEDGGGWLGIWSERDSLLGPRISRVHYGLTTLAQWQFTERRRFGHPKTLPALRSRYLSSGIDTIPTIAVPTVFLVNLESFPHLEPQLDALQGKANIAVVLEISGRMSESWDILNYPEGVRVRIHSAALLSRTGAVGSQPDIVVPTIDSSRIADLASQVLTRKGSAPPRDAYSFPEREERRYAVSMAPLSREQRLLGLMKIWVTIRTFDAYLDRASVDWSRVLRDWIPRVEATPTLERYFLALQELGTTLRDAHVSVHHPSTDERLPSNRTIPVRLLRVQGKVLIVRIDTAEAKGLDLAIGDEITAIDGVSVADIETLWRRRQSMAIEESRLKILWEFHWGIVGPENSPIVLTTRDVRGNVKTIHTTRTYAKARQLISPHLFGYTINELPGQIGYINFFGALANEGTLDSALLALKDTRGMILDMRGSFPQNFPRGDPREFLTSRFMDTAFNSKRSLLPMVSMHDGPPGRGWYERESVYFPYREKGAPVYTKPIVVIVNERLQSAAETLGGFFKAAGRATYVGSSTQGTNGGAPDFSLPGGGYMVFTHERILNPDGSPFQGVGIIPDVYVEPTVAGIRQGRDEVLERAIQVLQDRIARSAHID